jgi:uncharacterized protein YfdQ (DUF2303 family)
MELDEMNEAHTIGAFAVAALDPVTSHGGIPYVTLPPGYIAQSLEHLLPAPSHITQTVRAAVFTDFLSYVNEYKRTETRIFVNSASGAPTFTAVLDYHETGDMGRSGQASWCSHRCVFSPVPTEDWLALQTRNRQQFSQSEFAEWLEDHAHIIAAPAAAEILELVQTLEVKASVDFTSGVRLHNGQQQLKYIEAIEAKGSMGSQQGMITLPERITFVVEPFKGVKSCHVHARLKYRLASKKVTFHFELVRPGEIVDQLKTQWMIEIGDETGILPWEMTL